MSLYVFFIPKIRIWALETIKKSKYVALFPPLLYGYRVIYLLAFKVQLINYV